MVDFRTRFLKDLARRGNDNGVCGEDQGGFFGGGDFEAVHGEAFLRCCTEDVFDGGERFGEVFREGGRVGGEVREANLREELSSSGGCGS